MMTSDRSDSDKDPQEKTYSSEEQINYGKTKLGIASDNTAGNLIGPYKLLEPIGEGGMGTVWVASQSKPIKRKVAIKLIKAGMDSGQVLARFETERQALALMDHPNIARVLDGGVTERGRPYFAMEYVKGVPLTEYCNEAKLSLKERLNLFLPICHAVQHAHQKGIIHRDLKPSNILICLYDGKPVAKVIDFGLAKAMHHSLTEQSLYTAHGMMVGTPLYMSPEQAEQNNLDIDTRTDIYALGVILYELLTGTTPLDKAQIKQAAYNEILRLIKEVEPPKPSMRLSGSETLPSVAAQRSIDPVHLTRSITGDLDWVVMKALEKERSRRYDTANGLAEDIRRHLSDEPVSASPPSTRYRMQKFIKRNRASVIAFSAIAIALLLGIAGTTGGMLWALEERKQAVEAREAESIAKLEAQESAALAKEEAIRATDAEKRTAETLAEVAAERDAKEQARKEAEQISTFLADVLRSPDPTRDGHEIMVVELLDRAAKKLESDLPDQTNLRIRLQHTLARTYYSLGLYREAITLWEENLDYHTTNSGPAHSQTLSVMNNLAIAFRAAGRRDEALKLREEVLSLRRKAFDQSHPQTLSAMHNLAISYDEAGRSDESLKLMEEVLRLRRKKSGSEHPDTLKAVNNLAIAYRANGRPLEALKLQKEVLAIRRKTLTPEHPSIISAMNNLAVYYDETGFHNEAQKLYEEVLLLRLNLFGPEHPNTLKAMNNLAISYATIGRREEAIKIQDEVLTLTRKVHGPEHPRTREAIKALSISYNNLGFELGPGKENESIKAWQKAIDLNPRIKSNAPYSLGVLLQRVGKPADAFIAYLIAIRNRVKKSEATEKVKQLLKKDENVEPCLRAAEAKSDLLLPAFILFASNDRTKDALSLLVEFSTTNPSNTYWTLKLATLQVWFGQDIDFKATRQRMLAWAADSKDFVATERIVKLACLMPLQEANSQAAVLALARKSIELGAEENAFLPWIYMSLGMAEYRNGQYEEAVKTLTTASTTAPENYQTLISNTANFYRTMCLFQLGQKDEAQTLFTSNKETMKPLPTDGEKQLANHDDLILWLAYKEAKSLLAEPKSTEE